MYDDDPFAYDDHGSYEDHSAYATMSDLPDAQHYDDPQPVDEAPGGHVEMDHYGTVYDAGQATVDSDGDGVADTAVIHSPGQDEYYTDTDGDGKADELTILGPGGEHISHTESSGDGTWHEAPFPEDPPSPGVEHHTAAGGEAGTAPVGEHVSMDHYGTVYDTGRATIDTDGDGVADTSVIHSPGQDEYYTDTDGDGKADQLTIYAGDGAEISHTESAGDGTWHEAPFPDDPPSP